MSSLLQAELIQLLHLSSYVKYASPFIIFLAFHWSISSTSKSVLQQGAELLTGLQMWPPFALHSQEYL